MGEDWTIKYLAQTWEEVGGCWGLYQACVKDRLNITLPIFPAVSISDMRFLVNMIKKKQAEAQDWVETSNPVEGDCVAMSSIHNVFNHVGYYMKGGYVLHSTRKCNTGVSKLSHLNLLGYKEYKIYKHEKFNRDS
ncbi:MAG: hypothetical protein CMI54_05675 [Parcubacteria group bacterium]|jgi:cell wall-associated NlpC family hydrolase|nr:hypothetical protein [Parcubacteria group bacterium]|tara:strand:- start:15606 stop:16010 length:405 start_codon:yes stop_codon:yes gene_type:complete